MKIIQFYFILAVFTTLSILYFLSPIPQIIINDNYKNKCNGNNIV